MTDCLVHDIFTDRKVGGNRLAMVPDVSPSRDGVPERAARVMEARLP